MMSLQFIFKNFYFNMFLNLFSGKCPPDGNPCTQICFNIHNNMYECGCKNGFVLSADGYNCILQEGKLKLSYPQVCFHFRLETKTIIFVSWKDWFVKSWPYSIYSIILWRQYISLLLLLLSIQLLITFYLFPIL